MKKIIIFLISILVLTGCSCGKSSSKETPTHKVENFLSKYQTLDTLVLTQLNDVLDSDSTLTYKQREKYKDIMKKNYQKLTYEIKDEKIDGTSATVTAQIEVIDMSKVLAEAQTYLENNQDEFKNTEGNYDVSLYNDYRLDKMEKVEDRIKYTIDFTLSKIDNEWYMDDISSITESKIHGTYTY